jgi:hypothetical protein
VGSAETVEFDQTLDQIVVDAVPKGQFKFMFQVYSRKYMIILGIDSVLSILLKIFQILSVYFILHDLNKIRYNR